MKEKNPIISIQYDLKVFSEPLGKKNKGGEGVVFAKSFCNFKKMHIKEKYHI